MLDQLSDPLDGDIGRQMHGLRDATVHMGLEARLERELRLGGHLEPP